MNGRAIPGAYLFRPFVCDKDFVPWLKTSVWITLKTFWKKEKFNQLRTDFWLLL